VVAQRIRCADLTIDCFSHRHPASCRCPGTRTAMHLLREGHPNAAFLTYERLLKAAGILEDDSIGNMVRCRTSISESYC
jgi:hypothetical protein